MTEKLFTIKPARLMLLALLLASTVQAEWGWDGGCGNCPEHTSKDALTRATWIRLQPPDFDVFYVAKDRVAKRDWSGFDRDVLGWGNRGKKIILCVPFHGPDLSNAEIISNKIALAAETMKRYCDPSSRSYCKGVVGFLPTNEPWILDEDPANVASWGYKFNRLGSPCTNGLFWSQTPKDPAIPLTDQAIAWFAKMKELYAGIHVLTAQYGIQTFGPHWQKPSYDTETQMLQRTGVMDYIDVFDFGCDANQKDWWTYIDRILPFINWKPWGCSEFHLNHEPAGPADIIAAQELKRGLEHWKEKGVNYALIHVGLFSLDTKAVIPPTDQGARMTGFMDDRPTWEIKVVDQVLSP